MQILHPFAGSVQQYTEQLTNPDCYRPGHCPQCHTKHPLTAHGFYTRTLIDAAFDGIIRVRRYLCQTCQRTVSLLPEFILPYLRSSLTVIALFLIARLLQAQTLLGAAKVQLDTGDHPALLKDTVTTPAGCTIDGILELEEGKLRVTLIKAVVKATQRAKELMFET